MTDSMAAVAADCGNADATASEDVGTAHDRRMVPGGLTAAAPN
jgi:hypothetical protein